MKLKINDCIAICAPAKTTTIDEIIYARDFFISNGFQVVIGKNILNNNQTYLSNTIEQRVEELQEFIDDPNVKGIWMARGGFGCIHIIDQLDFKKLYQSPKWIIGYSDITVFHLRLQELGLQSIHSSMPIDFKENLKVHQKELINILIGNCSDNIKIPSLSYNRVGKGTGKLIGGNLSVLYSMTGTLDVTLFDGAILILEEIGEYIYHIDRMLENIKRNHYLSKLNGLIIAGIKDTKDTSPKYPYELYDIVHRVCKDYSFPIAFEFPVGHQPNNTPIVLGSKVQLSVDQLETELRYDDL